MGRFKGSQHRNIAAVEQSRIQKHKEDPYAIGMGKHQPVQRQENDQLQVLHGQDHTHSHGSSRLYDLTYVHFQPMRTYTVVIQMLVAIAVTKLYATTLRVCATA